MKQYIYLVRPVRRGFAIDNITEHEARVMQEHSTYLETLMQRGQLILCGPCMDAAFGVAIFEAASDEEAREIVEADPAVRSAIMASELHPYRVSLMRS